METATTGQENGIDSSAGPRRAIDATIADLREENYDHYELANALLEARDTLLVNGRIPDWFGQEEAPAYRHTTRD
ncbi:hypothetical protein [Halegenticoccus soli]|uniref:hypothetical protein n=1 Tax=Halegenticoccus soli TaxID=1985678 RepID=UPI000C6D015C|nr:hypothetical protein [Halegenticoccus soli]